MSPDAALRAAEAVLRELLEADFDCETADADGAHRAIPREHVVQALAELRRHA